MAPYGLAGVSSKSLSALRLEIDIKMIERSFTTLTMVSASKNGDNNTLKNQFFVSVVPVTWVKSDKLHGSILCFLLFLFTF